jgi:hypothetical protein
VSLGLRGSRDTKRHTPPSGGGGAKTGQKDENGNAMSKGIRLYFRSREDQESNGGPKQTGLRKDSEGNRLCDAVVGKEKRPCNAVLTEVELKSAGGLQRYSDKEYKSGKMSIKHINGYDYGPLKMTACINCTKFAIGRGWKVILRHLTDGEHLVAWKAASRLGSTVTTYRFTGDVP